MSILMAGERTGPRLSGQCSMAKPGVLGPPGSWNRRLLAPTAAPRLGSPSTYPQRPIGTAAALGGPLPAGPGLKEGGGDRLRGASAPAQPRGPPKVERQPRRHPEPPDACLRQSLRRSGVQPGSAQGSPRTTAHREAPPATASPAGLPSTSAQRGRRRGRDWSRDTPGTGDTRGGAQGAEDRPFVMSPRKEAGLFVLLQKEQAGQAEPGARRRWRVPLGVCRRKCSCLLKAGGAGRACTYPPPNKPLFFFPLDVIQNCIRSIL